MYPSRVLIFLACVVVVAAAEGEAEALHTAEEFVEVGVREGFGVRLDEVSDFEGLEGRVIGLGAAECVVGGDD